MKNINLLTKICLNFILISAIISCSDDDNTMNNGEDLIEESSYEISIEGEGIFTRGEVAVEGTTPTITGAWFENPDFNTEKLTCVIIQNEFTDLSLNGVIMLQDGSALEIGDASEINDDSFPKTKLIVQLSNTTYLSKSGDVTISNLEINPQSISEVPGDSSMANYTMDFTGLFDIGETFDVEESIEITGNIKVFTAPLNF